MSEPSPPDSGESATGITVGDLLRTITPTAWVTPLIAALIVIAFVGELAMGVPLVGPTAAQLLAVGGNFGPLFVEGQWWRPLSSIFVHAGILHIAFNLWAFWNAGVLTERIFGNAAFLVLYFLGGFGGALASLVAHPFTVSVGASGAVFGVYGALLAFAALHRGVFPPTFLTQQRNSILGFLGYNIVFGLAQHNTDMAAHAGGFVIGMAAGAVLGRDVLRPREHVVRRLASAVGLTALLLITAGVVRARILALPTIAADRHAQAGLARLNAHELAPAIDELTQALELERDPSTLTNRALAYAERGELALAEKDLREVIALESSPGRLALLCDVTARLRTETDDLEQVARECGTAIDAAEAPATKAELLALRAFVRHRQSRLDDAVADATLALGLADNVLARALRAEAALALGRPDDAEADCLALLSQATPLALHYRLCFSVANARHDVAARGARAEGWAKAAPTDTAALVALSWSRHAEGRVDEALAVLERLVENEPAEGAAWNNLAWMRVTRGEFAPALEAAERAVALEPDSPFFLGTRCFARVGLGEKEKARADCARAVALRPEERTDRGMLAFIDGRFADARRDWQAVVTEEPDRAADIRPWLAKLPPR